MIELEVKLGPKTGLETVQNEKHAVVEVAPQDDSNQAPLVRVTIYTRATQGNLTNFRTIKVSSGQVKTQINNATGYIIFTQRISTLEM